MVHICVVFSYVVTIVGWPRLPVMAKLLLLFLALQPVETHFRDFFPLWGYVVVDDSKDCGVVGLNWCRWLHISHNNESVAGGNGFATIDIEGAKLGLSGG